MKIRFTQDPIHKNPSKKTLEELLGFFHKRGECAWLKVEVDHYAGTVIFFIYRESMDDGLRGYHIENVPLDYNEYLYLRDQVEDGFKHNVNWTFEGLSFNRMSPKGLVQYKYVSYLRANLIPTTWSASWVVSDDTVLDEEDIEEDNFVTFSSSGLNNLPDPNRIRTHNERQM